MNGKEFTDHLKFLEKKLIDKYRYKDEYSPAATAVYGSRKYNFTECVLKKTNFKKDKYDEQNYTMRTQYIFLDDWEYKSKSNNDSMDDPIILRTLCESKEFFDQLSEEKQALWASVKSILEALWEKPYHEFI